MGTGPVPIFKGSSGLVNTLDPLRVPWNPETGIMGLAAAVNVVIDDSGMVSRRDGFSEVDSGSWHSVFCDRGPCVAVKGDTLYLIAEDLSLTSLRSGLSRRLSFAQANDDLYYTSLDGFGIVSNGVHKDWIAEPYVGPDTNRTFTPPYPAEHVAFWNGRIWLAMDNHIVCSEPFGWSWFDLHGSSILMDSRVRMLKPAQQGMFISSSRQVYFLSGNSPEDYNLKLVDDVPALEHSAAVGFVDGIEMGMEFPGLVVFWVSEKGPVLGSSGGFTVQLSKDRVVYPETAPIGASLLRGYNLVHTMGV